MVLAKIEYQIDKLSIDFIWSAFYENLGYFTT